MKQINKVTHQFLQRQNVPLFTVLPLCRLAATLAAFGNKEEAEPPVSAKESLCSFEVPVMDTVINPDPILGVLVNLKELS